MSIPRAAILIAATAGAVAQVAAQSVIAAAPAATAIQLDGKLDEAAWKQSIAIELFQQAPKPREATPYRTTVRVLLTRDTLYIGF